MCVTEMHVLVIKTEFSNIASDSDKNLFMQLCNKKEARAKLWGQH